MFDKDTLVVSYDDKRGEPRGSRKRSIDHKAAGLGDCINCGFCVQVCPTGIDIRNGLQYECISCSACIDACDSVMHTMGYQPGLIRYTTQNALDGKPVRVLRPRVIIYAGLLLFMVSALAYSIHTRVPLGLDVIRDRNRLYREVGDDQIENVYTLKVLNMDQAAHNYHLRAGGIHGLKVILDQAHIRVAPGEVQDVAVRLRAEDDELHVRSTKVHFILTAVDNPRLSVRREARFLGPVEDH
jgi:cytochrome c oxidase accessory protein FixG